MKADLLQVDPRRGGNAAGDASRYPLEGKGNVGFALIVEIFLGKRVECCSSNLHLLQVLPGGLSMDA